jgi:hypothetical protein
VSFLDLLTQSSHLGPARQHDWVLKELPKKLLEAGIPLATKHSEVLDRIVIGIADFVVDDYSLLDSLNGFLRTRAPAPQIEVFIMTTQSEIDEYVPGIGQVFHSPVVGVWKSGHLYLRKSGHSAREFLKDKFEGR